MSDAGREPGTNGITGEAVWITRIFGRPFFLSLTIGIPFCTFKILFGMTAVRIASPANLPLMLCGGLAIAWAGTDFLMNTGRALLDLLGLPCRFEYCIIAQAGRIVHLPGVFLSLDTFLSFCIICFMLWSGWITHLTPDERWLWYAATTLNLISLSLVALYAEFWRATRKK